MVFYQLTDGILLSDFDKRFQDFAFLEQIASFMLYPFGEDVEVDLRTSKIALFHLNTSAVKDENLILRADIELKVSNRE